MKKLLLTLVAFVSLAFVSCDSDPSYVITYYDNVTSYSNLTIFEYSDDDVLLNKREVKDARNGEVLEYDLAQDVDCIVVGCEGVVGSRIIEWYSRPFEVDDDETNYIDIDYVNITTYPYNPINSEDVISRYLYK